MARKKKPNIGAIVGGAIGGVGGAASHAGGGGKKGGNAVAAASSGVSSVSAGVGSATGATSPYVSAGAGVASVASGVAKHSSSPTAPSYSSSRPTTTIDLTPLVGTITDPATRALASTAIKSGIKYEVNPSVLLAAADITDYGRKGSGRGYTNLGDGLEDGAKSIKQAAQYLSEAGFHNNPRKAIRSLARATGADPAKIRKIASGYTALDDAARRVETTPGDVKARGVGTFKARPVEDRPSAKARRAVADAMKLAGQATGARPVSGTEAAAVNTENSRRRIGTAVPPSAQQPAGPRPRKIARRLERAVGRATPEIEGMTDPDQAIFAGELAKQTGLSPRVVAAWVRQEGGNPNGDNNWLNIGWTGSGPASVTNAPEWQNPKTAAAATAKWLAGKFGSQYSYVASDGIQAILPSAVGKSDQQQINAITNSGWAGDPAYTENVTRNYNEVSADAGKDIPKQLVQRAKKVLGGDATRALMNGGKLVKDKGPDVQRRKLVVSEMFYDPGINLKNGAETSAVGGHGDHVHFASDDPASILIVARKAHALGLLPEGTGENPAFDTVEPVHTTNSYHYREMQAPGALRGLARKAGASGKTLGQALDISGDPAAMAKLNQWIASRSGKSVDVDMTIPIKGTGLAVKAPTQASAAATATGAVDALGGALSAVSGGTTSSGSTGQRRSSGYVGSVGSIQSAAAAYARRSLQGSDESDPLYQSFRPRR